jgi:hypothetical protein
VLAFVISSVSVRTSAIAQVAQGKAGANAGTVYISRPSQWVAYFISINITANGKPVGSISDGQCIRVTLPAGRYTISGIDAFSAPFRIRPDSVNVSVRESAASYVVITPRQIFPGNYTIYEHRLVSSGRRC